MRKTFAFASAFSIAASLLAVPVAAAADSPCPKGSIVGFKEKRNGWECRKKKGKETIDFLKITGCWAASGHKIVLKFVGERPSTWDEVSCSNGKKRSFPEMTRTIARAEYS
ncbi:hypothetical protein GCM10022247_16120 [Allokutzneria multivorans]|uniref:Uncharacterized protein n=1 Tax=Allokutzneria multivorans TaxID=1142134 RepID=A0ABP7RFS6_9PSEU